MRPVKRNLISLTRPPRTPTAKTTQILIQRSRKALTFTYTKPHVYAFAH